MVTHFQTEGKLGLMIDNNDQQRPPWLFIYVENRSNISSSYTDIFMIKIKHMTARKLHECESVRL